MRFEYGTTRYVLITKNHAIKFPSFYSWKFFLMGLVANITEKFWWDATKSDKLCPVKYYCLGGFFLVMPRVDRTCYDSDDIDYDSFKGLPDDHHPENFGIYNGRIVMIDYGSF